MITLTLGEATAMPAIPAYINDLSPTSSKGKYQGLTLSTSSIGRALGPLFGGIVIDNWGYINFFIVAAIGIFLTLVLIGPLHKQLKSSLFFINNNYHNFFHNKEKLNYILTIPSFLIMLSYKVTVYLKEEN